MGRGGSIWLRFAYQPVIKSPMSLLDDWHTDETIDRRSVLCLRASQFVLCIKSLGKKNPQTHIFSVTSPCTAHSLILPHSQNKYVRTFPNHNIILPFFGSKPTTWHSSFHNATGEMQHGEVCATE